MYIVILIEFQSTVYRFMALRMLNYITNFYMDYVESNKHVSKLPSVFPILLYNGDKPWTAPLNLSELIEDHELLWKYALSFEYFKIVEREYTRDELLNIHNIVSTLFLTETYYDLELVKEELVELFENEEDREAFSLFVNWFIQLYRHGTVSQADYNALKQHLYCSSGEVKTMLETLNECLPKVCLLSLSLRSPNFLRKQFYS